MKTSKWLNGAAGLALVVALTGCKGEGAPGERDAWSSDVPEAVALNGDETWAQRPSERPPEPAAEEEAEPEEEATDDDAAAEPTTPATPAAPTDAMVAPPVVTAEPVDTPVPPPPPEDKPEG